MTEREFDVLDELYFIQSFDSLLKEVGGTALDLKSDLIQLFDKEWVKCFVTEDKELLRSETDIAQHYEQYYYVADKKGLLAHNSL